MDLKICRVCLDKAGTIPLYEENDGVKNSELIRRCVNVIFEEGDGLPDTLCEGCFSELNIAYEFKQKCEASDRALRCLDLLQTTPEIETEPEPCQPENVKEENSFEETPLYYDSTYFDDDHTRKEDDFDQKVEPKKYKKSTDNVRKQKSRVKTGPIQCIECGKIVPCHSAYEKHRLTHTKEKPFGCDICNKYFRYKYSLTTHIKKHTFNFTKEESDKRRHRKPLNPILCVICGKKIQSKSAMQLHMRTHTGEKPYKCDLCDKSFALKGSLQRHKISHKTKTNPMLCKYVCEHCGKKFPSKSTIIVHLRVHTGDKPYVCPYCQVRFCQISSLIRHKRIHTGDKPFSCLTCGKAFANKYDTLKHQLVHTNEKKFPCNICNKYLKSKASLKVHVNVTHGVTKSCVCNHCGMTFGLKGNLTLHIKRRHSEKSGFCAVCNKTFSDMPLHLRIHNGERPFACKICDQSYTTKNGLSHHINFKHRDNGKFKCSTGNCNKSFPKISMLEYHVLKTHLDSTPYICHHCKRGFLRPSDLSRHLKYNHLDTQTQVKSQFIKTIKLDD